MFMKIKMPGYFICENFIFYIFTFDNIILMFLFRSNIYHNHVYLQDV